MKKQIRQGDVLLIPIPALPSGLTPIAPDKGRTVLAYGEVTGHCHAIDASVSKLFAQSGIEDRFLEVTEPCEIVHEEHTAHPVAPGLYKVRIQREYDLAGEIRRVAD